MSDNNITEKIAQIIRIADGDHTLGAAALAEVLVSELDIQLSLGGQWICYGVPAETR